MEGSLVEKGSSINASEVIAFNGSGRAPAAANIDWYKSRNYSSIPTYGVHSVSVPGAIDAWCRLLADHGRKGIDAALAPAIHYAESGYIVHDRVAFDWATARSCSRVTKPPAGYFFQAAKRLLQAQCMCNPNLPAHSG